MSLRGRETWFRIITLAGVTLGKLLDLPGLGFTISKTVVRIVATPQGCGEDLGDLS